MSTPPTLPIPILDGPHWRVNIRPPKYQRALIPNLAKCFRIVEQTKVRLRGWDYPHLSNREQERPVGSNWVGSWADFLGHQEYWRMYQSGQFIHLFSIREISEKDWLTKLRDVTKFHLSHVRDIDWGRVPGFINIANFLFTITEIFEFATRLCQAGLYSESIIIAIELRRIQGVLLTTDVNRAWSQYCAASEDTLSESWEIRSSDLIARSSEHAINTVVWFVERFGWTNPSTNVLKKDQESFLKGLS